MENIKDRKYGIDLIRILAVLFVLIFHFFLNTYFYTLDHSNMNIKLQNIIRNFTNTCVPLFVLITGFLNVKTKYDKKFFKSLINILIIWLFYSVFEYLTINIINNTMDNLNLREFIYAITSFKAVNYSWYIEMFISLYLISPLLNLGYNNLEKKDKNILVLIILCITIIFPFLNILLNNSLHFPSYWNSIYLISYYFIGKWISTNKINIKKSTIIILLLLNQIFVFSFSRISSIEFFTLPTFINSILLFLLLYDINIKSNKLKKVIVYFSSISLDIYLASSLIDQLVYPNILKIPMFSNNQELLFIYSPLIIISIFIICSIYASIRKLLIRVR